MGKRVLEVVSVNRAVDPHTGEGLHRVTFGTAVDLSEKERAQVRTRPGEKSPKSTFVVQLVMYAPASSVCAYRAGEQWLLNSDPSGTLELTRA